MLQRVLVLFVFVLIVPFCLAYEPEFETYKEGGVLYCCHKK